MLIDKVKTSLRVDDSALDEDIQDSIDAAKADLVLNGVLNNKIIDTDSLIIRAIKVYCKAEYSSDDKESTKYRESYEMLRNHLCMSLDYAYFKITINAGIQSQVIFDGEIKQSDANGVVIFYSKAKEHVQYIINKIVYYTDITADVSITVVV